MKARSLNIISKFAIVLAIAISFSACVESLSDSTSSSSTSPSIEITYPKTNDTVIVGRNTIQYKANDAEGGQGLSHIELYMNGIYAAKYQMKSGGENPDIYIWADSTMIGNKFNYHLVAFNKQGKSKASKIQENIFIKDKPPTAPTNLMASYTSTNTVTLLWDDNSYNEKGFELWRKDIGPSGVIEYRRIKVLPNNTISTTDLNLSANVAYYYLVRAYHTWGYSAFSNEVSPSNNAGGPWNLKAEGVGNSYIHLTWTDFIPNESGFIIERTDPVSTNFKQLKVIGPNITSYDDYENITPGLNYTYRVQYFTSNYKSPYSNTASAALASFNVAEPKLLVLGRNASNQTMFTWEVANTASGYDVEIEWSIDGINYSKIETIPGGTKAPPPPYIHTKSDTRPINRYRVRLVLSSSGNSYTKYSNIIGPF